MKRAKLCSITALALTGMIGFGVLSAPIAASADNRFSIDFDSHHRRDRDDYRYDRHDHRRVEYVRFRERRDNDRCRDYDRFRDYDRYRDNDRCRDGRVVVRISHRDCD